MICTNKISIFKPVALIVPL